MGAGAPPPASEVGEDGTRNPNTANAATASAFGFADWGCRAAPAQRSAAVPSVWGRPAPPAGAGPRWRRARLVRRHVSGGFSRRFRYTVQRLSSQASVRNRNALVPAYREAHQAQVAGPLWPEDATKIKQATCEMPVRRSPMPSHVRYRISKPLISTVVLRYAVTASCADPRGAAVCSIQSCLRDAHRTCSSQSLLTSVASHRCLVRQRTAYGHHLSIASQLKRSNACWRRSLRYEPTGCCLWPA